MTPGFVEAVDAVHVVLSEMIIRNSRKGLLCFSYTGIFSIRYGEIMMSMC